MKLTVESVKIGRQCIAFDRGRMMVVERSRRGARSVGGNGGEAGKTGGG